LSIVEGRTALEEFIGLPVGLLNPWEWSGAFLPSVGDE